MKQIDENRMRGMVETAVVVAGSQKAFAQQVGVSEQYISDVRRGRRSVGAKLLQWFGMERVVFYRRADGGKF